MPAAPVPDPYAYLTPTPAPAPIPTPAPAQVPFAQPAADDPNTHVAFNPYPNMHQSVISPIGAQPPAPATPVPAPEPEKPSEKQLSPDIINLANNPDLSVETIAREANRIREKEKLSEDEVVISLR